MSSKSVPWSTLRNSTSHVQMSSVRFSLFSSSSAGGGSSLWYVHHWITFLRMAALTLGSGTGSSSPSSIPRSTHHHSQYHQLKHRYVRPAINARGLNKCQSSIKCAIVSQGHFSGLYDFSHVPIYLSHDQNAVNYDKNRQ